MSYDLRFLGTGAAHAVELGSSAVVLERDGAPLLLVDCGPDTLDRYVAMYGAPPSALYITHTHMDHVAGMERLFFRLWFDEALRGRTKVFLHAALLPWLQGRVADYPGALAEGGVNYWEAFHLVPSTRGFWHEGLWFDIFPTRHHVQGTSFGLALRGSFVFTGDTRPVPEALAIHAVSGEVVAHDCGVVGNPSHTGVDDLEREYPGEVRGRMALYHYGSVADGETLEGRGYRIARPGESLALPEPEPARPTAG
ncbi:MBL fold metallo-hydrolase [Luteibacter aegosomatissinici]|uniref:MBL fold metallo-hydrolase n=1 Tax=Luteibacter aegosomatissinici TaxID=2911539 RepID=UPI001FFA2CD5|nr:MBL fold metallo-hydrolase [Luteibacter aegosomatissinici]UPG93112.1 MBL fold metallo-hydrolase [Luteibacter aegosomatissinici]